MGGARFFRHGELALVILSLLRNRPMNTYQLLSAIESLFAGAYEPSTGAIYPAVGALRAEELIASDGGGAGRRYRLTDHGTRALAARRDDLAGLELRTGVRLAPDDSVDELLQTFESRVRQLARHVVREDLEAALNRTTQELLRLTDMGRGRRDG
jgi:DNA-binding PadR family transcriptional regulator